MVHGQVCNPGFLPTAVTVNLPNAKPVEMETWANEGEPTAEVIFYRCVRCRDESRVGARASSYLVEGRLIASKAAATRDTAMIFHTSYKCYDGALATSEPLNDTSHRRPCYDNIAFPPL